MPRSKLLARRYYSGLRFTAITILIIGPACKFCQLELGGDGERASHDATAGK